MHETSARCTNFERLSLPEFSKKDTGKVLQSEIQELDFLISMSFWFHNVMLQKTLDGFENYVALFSLHYLQNLEKDT